MHPRKSANYQLTQASKCEFSKKCRRVSIKNIPCGVITQDILQLLKPYYYQQIHVDKSSQSCKAVLLDGKFAALCVKELNGKSFRGQCLLVSLASCDFMLCITQLPLCYTPIQFMNLITPFGTPERCFLVQSEITGESKGYGCVEFTSKDSSIKAKNQLNGCKIDDNTLQVHWLDTIPSDYSGLSSRCLMVEGIPFGCKDNSVLSDLFSLHGTPIFCQLAHCSPNNFAIVEYDDPIQSENAWRRLNGCDIGNFSLKLSFCVPGPCGLVVLNALKASRDLKLANPCGGLLPTPVNHNNLRNNGCSLLHQISGKLQWHDSIPPPSFHGQLDQNHRNSLSSHDRGKVEDDVFESIRRKSREDDGQAFITASHNDHLYGFNFAPQCDKRSAALKNFKSNKTVQCSVLLPCATLQNSQLVFGEDGQRSESADSAYNGSQGSSSSESSLPYNPHQIDKPYSAWIHQQENFSTNFKRIPTHDEGIHLTCNYPYDQPKLTNGGIPRPVFGSDNSSRSSTLGDDQLNSAVAIGLGEDSPTQLQLLGSNLLEGLLGDSPHSSNGCEVEKGTKNLTTGRRLLHALNLFSPTESKLLPRTPVAFLTGDVGHVLPSPEPSPEAGAYVGQHSQGLGGHYADSYGVFGSILNQLSSVQHSPYCKVAHKRRRSNET